MADELGASVERGSYRLVVAAGLSDPVEAGEVVASYPAGTGLAQLRQEAVRAALTDRGVDHAIDYRDPTKDLWVRLMAVCYHPGWIVDTETGIVHERPDGTVQLAGEGDAASRLSWQRARFEHDRKKRDAKVKAAATRERNRQTAGRQPRPTDVLAH